MTFKTETRPRPKQHVYRISRSAGRADLFGTNEHDSRKLARHLVAMGEDQRAAVYRDDEPNAIAAWQRDPSGRCVKINL